MGEKDGEAETEIVKMRDKGGEAETETVRDRESEDGRER